MVLDAFLGSGTTTIASERTGPDPVRPRARTRPMCDVAIRRWQAFTGQSAVHALSGGTFTELEKEAGHVDKQ